MVPRITSAVCLFAAAITLILGLTCKSTAGLRPSDAVVLAFVLGPYLLLGLLAWWQRGEAIVSWSLLAVTVALATLGVCLFGLDSYRFHMDFEYRMSMRLTALFVPLLQWAAALVLGCALLANWAFTWMRSR